MTRTIPKRLFGFSPDAVATALQQQREKQLREVTQLEAALAAELQEQERLRHQVHWTEEQLGRQRGHLDELGRFQAGSDATIAIVHVAAQHQIQQLEVAGRQQRQALFRHITKLDQQIESARQALGDWLDHAERVAVEAESAVTWTWLLPEIISPARILPVPTPMIPDTHSLFPQLSEPEPHAAAASMGCQTLPLDHDLPVSPNPQPVGLLAEPLQQFLTGKVVGQDLYTSSGTLIATRGTEITSELTARVQAEGLLPQLVLYVAWPGEIELD